MTSPDLSGYLMKQDLESQADSLAPACQDFRLQTESMLRAGVQSWGEKSWVFTGCGATYALSLTAAALFKELGIAAAALPASEVTFYPELIPFPGSVLVAFSRSGETSETLWAVDSFHRQRPQGKVLAITTNPGSTLSHIVDLTLGSTAIRDRSLIETRSFTGMLYLAQLLSAWIGRGASHLDHLAEIPGTMKNLPAEIKFTAEGIGRDLAVTRFFFLASGPAYGLAYQSALMMKECSAEWVEAFHPLEFRHGPRSTAIAGSFVCLFLGDDPRASREEMRVVMEMKDQGARTLVLYDAHSTDIDQLKSTGLSFLDLGTKLPLIDRLPAYLPFFQWLAFERALAKGLDPDHPVHLIAVTKL